MAVTLVICAALTAHAQRDLEDGNDLFDKLAFAEAIPRFERALSDDPSLFEAKRKLADSYRLTGRYSEAEKWYRGMVDDSRATDMDRLHYGQMLMNNGKYEEARKWLRIAGQARPGDRRVQNHLHAIDGIRQFFRDSVNYTITHVAFNGPGNDFSPVFFNNGVVFTASIGTHNRSRLHSWTGESFTKLFFGDSAGHVQEFASRAQSKLNNGPVSIRGNEMYNTINLQSPSDGKNGHFNLGVVRYVYDGKSWTNAVNFAYNNIAYNIAHPAISPDGAKLYFSSDMPGGEGGMDLYVCERSGETWSKPVNLGKAINTAGNEVFPFIDSRDLIYFSSNGHQGPGGLDIYVASLMMPEEEPVALSYPVNTGFDDFGFIFDYEKKLGYFSSNRAGGNGGDDIYKFTFTPSVLQGSVKNKSTGKLLANAVVTVTDKKTGEQQQVTAASDGRFALPVNACSQYEISASHSGYATTVTREFQTSCNSIVNETEMTFSNPETDIRVVNKYTAEQIDAAIEVRDAETKEIVQKLEKSVHTIQLEPCHEYIIVAIKDGMPDGTSHFQTSCIAKDETVTIAMGLPPVDPNFIAGIVYDQETKLALDSAAIILYDINNVAVATITSAGNGQFGISGFKNIDRLVFFRNGYFSVTRQVRNAGDKRNIVIEMPGLKMDKIIQLEGIYYDLGKSTIRPDAARVLDNVVKVMQENTTLEIELGAHTDARGNDLSNLQLSDKRAKAAAAYIISKGIDEKRIAGKGFGETVLKNKCGNGVKCGEKQHQENRRTEVRIVKY